MTRDEAYQFQTDILNTQYSEQALFDIFTALDRPLSTEELLGFYTASKEAMLTVPTSIPALDTCGTGGDGLDTFNISTTAALLLASLGVPVAKHGNRSSSGRCGSADVLEALGLTLTITPEEAARCLSEHHFCFLFAPLYHPAFKHVAAARKRYGKRTYFNLLGPLLNPANAPYRLVGVADPSMASLIGETLIGAGVERTWVVHSKDGMDEISPTGTTLVHEFVAGGVPRTFTIDPEEHGLDRVSLADLTGGDAPHNAAITRALLEGGGTSAAHSAVVLNAAAGLTITGTVDTFSLGVTHAKAGLASGIGARTLDALRTFGS